MLFIYDTLKFKNFNENNLLLGYSFIYSISVFFTTLQQHLKYLNKIKLYIIYNLHD